MIDSRLLAMMNIGVPIGMNNTGWSLYWFSFPNEYKCTMDLRRLLKTTERYVALLNVNGIFTVKDFLNYFPRTHEDRQTISSSFVTKESDNPLSGLGNEKQRVRVLVTEKKITVLRNKKKIYQVLFEDEDGVKWSAWFRWTGYQLQNIEKNQRYVIVWKPKLLKGKVSFSNPEFIPSSAPESVVVPIDVDDFSSNNAGWVASLAIADDVYNIGRPYPVYPEMQGIKPGRFAKKMREVLHYIESEYTEYLPDDFRKEFALIDIVSMVKWLHYPKDFDELSAAKHRLYFDKLLKVQLQSLIARDEYKKSIAGTVGTRLALSENPSLSDDGIDRSVIKEIMDGLPFSLTDAQKKVIKQTIEDVHKSDPMLRLVQGDVGSGKTIVAAICAYYIIRKMRGQVALLVPIEVLAIQHFANFVKLFHPLGIQVRLLTGSVTASQKLKIKQEMKSGLIDIVIGLSKMMWSSVIWNLWLSMNSTNSV
jgi:RecG-like helicase